MNARGLATSPIYYDDRALEIVFDLDRHVLEILTSEGWESRLALKPRTVADFFEIVMVELGKAAVHVVIDEHPSEIPDAIPFMPPMILIMLTASGKRCSRPTVFLKDSEPASSANAAPCISSGGVSIWR